jgi:MFS family permease
MANFFKITMQMPYRITLLAFMSSTSNNEIVLACRKKERLKRSLTYSCAEGMAAECLNSFIGGTVLIAWTIYLKGGPLAVGIVGSLPYFAQLVHLPSALFTAHLGARRVAIFAVGISRQVFWPLVFLPFLNWEQAAKLHLLVIIAAVSSVLAVIGNNAWVAWMSELVPPEIRGSYFGRRNALCALSGITASLGAGLALDRGRLSHGEGLVLSCLALTACIVGAATTWLMTQQQDTPGSDSNLSITDSIRPFLDPTSRRVLAYQVGWNGAIGVASVFFTVHMIHNLKMSYSLIALQATGVALVRIVAVQWWGKAIDRLGAKPVLIVCSYGIALIPLLWLLPTPQRLWPVILDSIATGILWSGHNLASFALPLAIAPSRGRPFYIAAFSTASGLTFACASSLGGIIAKWLPDQLFFHGWPFFGLQILFVLSCLARFSTTFLVTRIHEPGAGSVSQLLRDIFRCANSFFLQRK